MKNTSEQNSSTIERTLAAAGVAALVGGAGAVWYFNPSNVNFFPVCPLYSATGIACPGCGLTRGFHALFHGDVLDALDFNALIPVYALIFAYFFLTMLLTAVRGRGITLKFSRPNFLWSFLAIAVIFAVVRNIPAYPFSVLYP